MKLFLLAKIAAAQYECMNCEATYINGKYIGKLNSYHHQVNGQIYAVKEKTLLLKGFQYDGQGRDAFFYGGGTGRPGPSGFIIPNEYYRSNVLER